jgi:hypothetical protein
MPASIQRRKASFAWLAMLAILWHAVPFAAAPTSAADARILHLDICSAVAGAPIETDQGGSTPGDREPGTHECTLCGAAMAQIAGAHRPDCPAHHPSRHITGVSGEGVAPRLAAALPPPPCGPPAFVS